MNEFIKQLFVLLASPPGNLTYHAILAFSVFGALQSAINHARSSANSQGRRAVIGLSILLLVQLMLFASAGLAWQGVMDAHRFLPPLDRSIALFSLVVLAWLWAFPEPRRLADAAAILLALLVATLAVFGLVWWQGQDPASFFNSSAADIVAGGLGLFLILIAVTMIVIRRPGGWGPGLGMFLLLGVGYLAHWLIPPEEGDFPLAIRLAEMAAYPLLLALPQRMALVAEAKPKVEKTVKVEPRRYNTDPKIMQAFLSLATETNPKRLYANIARTISQLMIADISLLITPQQGINYLIFPVGYNLILDRALEGFSLDQRRLPMLNSYVQRSKPLRLPASGSTQDLQSLASVLGVNQAGHLLYVPVAIKDQTPLLGIVLVSPYSNRLWNEEDERYLMEAATSLASILQRMQQFIQLQTDLERSHTELSTAQAEIEHARKLSGEFTARLEHAQGQADDEHARAESLAALVASHEVNQETLSRLEARNQELEELVSQARTAPAGIGQFDGELRLALEEIASLRAALATAEAASPQPVAQGGNGSAAAQDTEVINSIAQELRQPMSSIIGYTDLLLGESAGLLGAMQRKFLERVKASTERMGGLVDELIQVTAINGGQLDLKPVTVDLNTVIDEAVGGMIAQLNERNIALRIDLPDEMPPILADKDALQQVLINLLQNASSATPEEGEVSLRARLETKENEPSYLLLQVSDQGGGIPTADMGRVFSRLYRADNPLIQGVGDTGVGLSIVKALVEAHQGRVWVDTEQGRGSTFSVLLRLAEQPLRQGQPGGAPA